MSVLAVSCAKENVGGGLDTGVSFTIEVPGAPVTKAEIGDGETATKLYYQVFNEDGTTIDGLGVQDKTLAGKTATVNFQLVKDQTYKFVFWAQTAADGYYTIDGTDGLKKITANYVGKNSNDENFDAFYAVEKIKVTGPVSKTVNLKRPFAQINIATAGRISAGTATKDIDFTGAASEVTVKNIPNVFSPLAAADDVFTGNADVTFAKAEVPAGDITVNSKAYKYLAVNYVFAPADGTVYDVNATLSIEGKDVSLAVPTVPAKQNWRTNIVGDLLTAGTDFTVVVDPGFSGDEDLDLVNIRNVASLKALFSNGGSAKLDADIELVDEAMAVLPGKSVVLNLNGHKIVNRVLNVPAIKVGGKLELDGDGTVDGGEGGNNNALCAMTGSELIIKGGTYTVGGDANNLANSCIYSFGGDVTIYGGYFRSECTYRNRYYVLNMYNSNPGSITVYGGKFENYDPTTGDDVVPSGFVADGYTSFKSGTNPDVFTVSSTAKLNANSDALRDAIELGGTVEITEDVLMTGMPYSIPAGKDTHISIAENVTVKVKDGSFNPYKVFSFYNDGGVLSGNGTIIADNRPQRNNACAVEVQNGNTLVIEGNLHIDGGSNAEGSNSAIRIDDGTVIIKGGYFTVGLDKNGGDNACVLLSAYGSHAALIVEDGVFEAEGRGTFVINCQDENKSKCDVQIKGGIFVGFNPADNTADGEHTNYVAAGYKSVETTYDGKQAWKVEIE